MLRASLFWGSEKSAKDNILFLKGNILLYIFFLKGICEKNKRLIIFQREYSHNNKLLLITTLKRPLKMCLRNNLKFPRILAIIATLGKKKKKKKKLDLSLQTKPN